MSFLVQVDHCLSCGGTWTKDNFIRLRLHAKRRSIVLAFGKTLFKFVTFSTNFHLEIVCYFYLQNACNKSSLNESFQSYDVKIVLETTVLSPLHNPLELYSLFSVFSFNPLHQFYLFCSAVLLSTKRLSFFLKIKRFITLFTQPQAEIL